MSSFLLSHWFMSLVSFAFLLFFVAAIWLTGPTRTTARTYAVDRVEKSADAVLNVCALLIPASLGLASWLHEKLANGSYTIGLAVAVLLFFIVLAFTIYIRFNKLLGDSTSFTVDFHGGSVQNRSIGYWQTTVMTGITLGLVLLAIAIATSWSAPLRPTPEGAAPVKVNCIVAGPTPPASLPNTQVPTVKSNLRSGKERKR